MTDTQPPWPPRVGRSVFGRLVTITVAMAVSLLAVVTAFFFLYVNPTLSASVDQIVQDYTRALAAANPGYETAKELAARVNMQIRYEGPGGTWATSHGLPTIAAARSEPPAFLSARHYYIVPSPDGGTYLFAWTFTAQARAAHLLLLTVLLLLVAAIVVATYAVLRHLLRPVRGLADGVARLGAGDLGTVVPRCSDDEFGALTDAFNGMVGRVREMIRARDQLLLDVSHELRSPVTRLKVAVELVGDFDMKARMAADLAEMEIMIGELIELERLRNGGGLKRARQDIVAILEEMARAFCERPPGVRVTSPVPQIAVEVDAERMRTVFRNLLENAVKYSQPDSRAVEVSAAVEDGRVVIRVTDDGPGIPEDDIPNLFEPFFRVDRSRSKKTGGYGLGLSIAKRIVDAHGGTLTARNNAGGGASFIVILPGSTTQALGFGP